MLFHTGIAKIKVKTESNSGRGNNTLSIIPEQKISGRKHIKV
jgi:hypothetical protein